MSSTGHRFKLKVTASNAYPGDKGGNNESVIVPVNTEKSVKIKSDLANVDLTVRVKNFYGEPNGCPSTGDYFKDPHHLNDTYSIQLRVQFNQEINGDDLLFGNDFDEPVRDLLPYGTTLAYNIVKKVYDPGLNGDPNADRPYLYGNALSSFNLIVRENEPQQESDSIILDESDSKLDPNQPQEGGPSRRSYFLNETHRKEFNFKPKELYDFDFYNGLIDMSDGFYLQLPGFKLDVMKYWNQQPLRYVLKTKDQPIVLINFTLTPIEEKK